MGTTYSDIDAFPVIVTRMVWSARLFLDYCDTKVPHSTRKRPCGEARRRLVHGHEKSPSKQLNH